MTVKELRDAIKNLDGAKEVFVAKLNHQGKIHTIYGGTEFEDYCGNLQINIKE